MIVSMVFDKDGAAETALLRLVFGEHGAGRAQDHAPTGWLLTF